MREASGGLSELRRVGEVATVPDEVGGVEQVEDLAEQDETHALAPEREGAAQAQVLGEEVVAEGKVGGQREARRGLAVGLVVCGPSLDCSVRPNARGRLCLIRD